MSYGSSNHPFLIQRPALFSVDQLERVEEAMMRILEDLGIAVLDDSDIISGIKENSYPASISPQSASITV